MNRRKRKWKKTLCGLLLLFGCCMYGPIGQTAVDVRPEETSGTVEMGEDTVLVGGMTVGIYMETNGVLVLDTQGVMGMDGQEHEPAHNLVKAGDYIIKINDTQISDKKELVRTLDGLDKKEVVLSVKREEEEISVKLDAVECEPGEFKLGIWVKDNIQGLGTITFLNHDSEFGALGHGIHDTDTGVLLNLSEGRVYKTSIRSVVKGTDGVPGSMEGLIIYNRYNRLGTIRKNTEKGIYGTLDDASFLFEEQMVARVASREEVHSGPAMIRCYVQDSVQEYEIQILEINESAHDTNKGMIIEVTDERLLQETGGIVQGMSGSPILQDGKLVGAVTHVFVNDPTKGYGIFADVMMREASE